MEPPSRASESKGHITKMADIPGITGELMMNNYNNDIVIATNPSILIKFKFILLELKQF